MNYIKKLEAESRAKGAELVGLKAGLTDLQAYLQSPKFSEDTTVQVGDVLRRIQEAMNKGTDLRFEQENMEA